MCGSMSKGHFQRATARKRALLSGTIGMLGGVRPFTFSYLNISKTTSPIVIKFDLKHYCGRGKVALGFGPGRIRTLVSMATDSSHRLTMGKT